MRIFKIAYANDSVFFFVLRLVKLDSQKLAKPVLLWSLGKDLKRIIFHQDAIALCRIGVMIDGKETQQNIGLM
mgnify:CR=1 FL=1